MQYVKFAIIVSFLRVSCNGVDNSKHISICLEESNKYDYKKVTFDELMKAPEVYKQKRIELEGFFSMVFENVGVYSNRNFEIGYWMNLSKEIVADEKKLSSFHKRRAIVRGIFNPAKKGHLNMFQGEIDSVICIISK